MRSCKYDWVGSWLTEVGRGSVDPSVHSAFVEFVVVFREEEEIIYGRGRQALLKQLLLLHSSS